MQGSDGYFDERVTAIYDEMTPEIFEPAAVDPIVDFLAERADGGRALELGIGTGRIALPLARRGVEVNGIEMSEAMISRLRAMPGGGEIGIVVGDFSKARADGKFALVFLVANTIMNLTTQDAQVACFQNAADHLVPGGRFVIEVGVPELQRLPPGETVRPFRVTEDRLGFDEYELAEQKLTSHHFRLIDGRWERFSIPFRYTWPGELDLMARLAGLGPGERHGGWQGEPFGDESRKLVAVWRKP